MQCLLRPFVIRCKRQNGPGTAFDTRTALSQRSATALTLCLPLLFSRLAPANLLPLPCPFPPPPLPSPPRPLCPNEAQAVIFCNTKKKVDWLTDKMRQANFTVSAMHGDMPQKERDEIMASRAAPTAVKPLCASDVKPRCPTALASHCCALHAAWPCQTT